MNHSALSVEIVARELVRVVRKESQRIRAFGGGYGFTSQFWDAHTQDFDAVVIRDMVRGEVWRGDRRALASVQRATLSALIGEQVIIPCARMTREIVPQVVEDAPEIERIEQADFFASLGRAARDESPRRTRAR